MTPWLIALAMLLGGIAFAVWWFNERGEPAARPAPERPMLAFVALLKKPRYLEPLIVATMVQHAWGVELPVRGDDELDNELAPEDFGGGFVMGQPPAIFICHEGRGVVVNTHSQPYVEDPESAAKSIADLRLRELFAQHRAWISCDATGVERLEEPQEVREWYRRLGRLLAELLDDDCLAIYVPHANQLFPNMEETWDMLRSDDPLETLHGDSPVPIIEVATDDPRMAAAVQQAQATFHDFVKAFEDRSGDQFGVKAPIAGGGNTEFIWLTVEAIENDMIYGRLANEPLDLGSLKIGSQVRTPVSELNDWAYLGPNGEARGLFTVKVLADAEQQRQEELDRDA